MPGLVAILAVQVDLALDHPAAAAQVAQHGVGEAVAQVIRFVATFEAILQADRTVQAFVQGGALVGDELLRARWRQRRAELSAIGRGQRLHAAHGKLQRSRFRIAGQGARRVGKMCLPVRRQGVRGRAR